MREPLLKMDGIEKSYGAIRALRGVDLTLGHGEVLALVGDNAAGKSTLMKVLSGAVLPDRGRIYLDGTSVAFRDPQDARQLGIEMVYQDLSLCDSIDVGKNLFLGREPVKAVFGIRLIDEGTLYAQTEAMLSSLDIQVPPVRVPVRHLSGGQRQAVAIARAVSFQPKILILDEPTAALAVKEVERVLGLILRLKQQGVPSILITHRLQDAFRVADRVMVMYEGEKVAERPTAETNLEEIIRLIVGRQNGVALKGAGGDVRE